MYEVLISEIINYFKGLNKYKKQRSNLNKIAIFSRRLCFEKTSCRSGMFPHKIIKQEERSQRLVASISWWSHHFGLERMA